MKTQFTKKGWNNIITTKIEVIKIPDKSFTAVEEWVSFNNRHPSIGRIDQP